MDIVKTLNWFPLLIFWDGGNSVRDECMQADSVEDREQEDQEQVGKQVTGGQEAGRQGSGYR